MKTYKSYLTMVILLILTTSCDKLLEVNPKQSIDSSIALQSKDGIEAAVISVYSRLLSVNQYGKAMLATAEALSNNAIHTGNSSNLQTAANNNIGSHLPHWQSSYYAINEINLILDALRGSTNYDQEWQAVKSGELHCLRALYYHNLVRAFAYDPTAIIEDRDFGGVPLMLVGVDDISKIGSLERAPINKVYEKIYSDLDSANTFFASVNWSKGPHRITKGAVDALYSRVALYNGDWQKVVSTVNDALEATTAIFSTKENFLADWRKEVHPESIFEVKFNEQDNLGSDNSLRGAYTSRGFYDDEFFTIQAVLAVDPAFLELYEEVDVRKQLFRLGVGANKKFHECYKFISKNGMLNLDNVPVIRLSELYLNRAEAYYHMGPQYHTNALADLNKIRSRAGLSHYNGSGEALLEEILKQRRLELAFEGHQWFDLKRNGRDVVKGSGNITFDDFRILAPIPEREISTSENQIKQNYGY